MLNPKLLKHIPQKINSPSSLIFSISGGRFIEDILMGVGEGVGGDRLCESQKYDLITRVMGVLV
jgi:hypothetical protein